MPQCLHDAVASLFGSTVHRLTRLAAGCGRKQERHRSANRGAREKRQKNATPSVVRLLVRHDVLHPKRLTLNSKNFFGSARIAAISFRISATAPFMFSYN